MLKRIIRKSLTFPVASSLLSALIRNFTPDFKQVIFVSSTGRSGTDSLSKLFAQLNDVSTQHEPIPIMHSDEMIKKNNGVSEPIQNIYHNVKSNMIRLEALAGNSIYVESNHMFIKSFIECAVADFGNKLTVIYLYRNPVDVAKSIYDLNGTPGTDYGNKWYLDFKAKENIIQISDILSNDKSFQHDFYKCLWYWYEIEARTNFWRDKYDYIKFVDFKTEDLNNRNKVIELFNSLDIKISNIEKNRLKIGERHNKKIHTKTNSLSLDAANKMHENFKLLLNK